jgi:hypothetical protein
MYPSKLTAAGSIASVVIFDAGISDSSLFNDAASGGIGNESLNTPSKSEVVLSLSEMAETLCLAHMAHTRSIVSIASLF